MKTKRGGEGLGASKPEASRSSSESSPSDGPSEVVGASSVGANKDVWTEPVGAEGVCIGGFGAGAKESCVRGFGASFGVGGAGAEGAILGAGSTPEADGRLGGGTSRTMT